MNPKIDYSEHLFRCSQLGELMTGEIGLTDKQEELYQTYLARYKGEGKPLTDKMQMEFISLNEKRKTSIASLSQTTKNALEVIHKENTFGRRKDFTNKYLEKGLAMEEKGVTFYSKLSGKFLTKNEQRFNNEFITGEPDNVQNMVRDIKNSWDFSTFPIYASDVPTKNYIWQLQGYMWLTGFRESELIYTLCDTPDHLILDEFRRTAWKLGVEQLTPEQETEIEFHLRFGDIDPKMRCKVFEVPYDESYINEIKRRVPLWRAYLNSLSVSVKEMNIKQESLLKTA